MSIDLSGFVKKKTKITIGTKVFTFTELTLADLAAFRGNLIEQRDKMNKQRRERLIKDAEKVGKVDPMELLKLTDSSMTEDEIEAQMETVEGIGYLAYLSLRHEHADISVDDTMKIISPAIIEKVTSVMFTSDADTTEKKTPAVKK